MEIGRTSRRQRFSIAAMLALMMTFGLLFGGLRYLNAPPAIYLFFGAVAVVICIVQTMLGAIPYLASTAAGALILPFCMVISAALGPDPLQAVVIILPCTMIAGGFLGYCTGVLATGVFSLVQMAESRVRQRGFASAADDLQHPAANEPHDS